MAGRPRHPEPIDPDLDAPARRGQRARRARPGILAAIAGGGALGACARYGLGLAVTSRPGAYPLGTFVINVSGSFALGALLVLVIERWRPSEYLRPFAATGFLGAYTTWSTFMVDADDLARTGHAAVAVGYLAGSLAAGLVATFTGMLLARSWPWARRRRGERR